MSLVTRSIPGLFGGVSQQIPAMRHPTQATEQTNGLATTTEGLSKRPGSKFLATLPLSGTAGANVYGSGGNAHIHWIDKGDAGLYALVLVKGNLMLYDALTGAPQQVAFSQGNSYLSCPDAETSFRCVTVADYTFITNLSKVPAMTAAVTPANPANVAYVNIKTAVANVTYTVTVNGQAVTTTAPASPTNASIALQLQAALATAVPGCSTSVLPGTNILKLTFGSTTLTTVTASDGWGNQATQTVHLGVDTFADLPPRFDTSGFVVTINGAASTAKDKYYVRWNGSRWEECRQPGLSYAIDAGTMPHQLRPDGNGGWVFERASWVDRKCGDEDTNPLPSFIGSPIRGIFFHRNRLGFLSDDALILSRAGQYFNFFASTATQVLDTDPIDLGAPSEQVDSLDWALTYNEDLMVWASNKQQFRLVAGDVMSPNTARLLPATTFETYNGVKPAALGNRLLFSVNTGSFNQLSLYRVSEDTVTNRSESLTEHVPSFVPANPRALVVSTAVKALAVIPRGVTQSIPFFKYEVDDKDLMTQKAWGTLTFPSTDTVRVMGAIWRSRTLVLLLHVVSTADAVAGGRFRLETIDFESTAQDAHAGYSLCLDSKVLVTAGAFDGTKTQITVPYYVTGPMVCLQVEDGVEPVELERTGALIQDTVNLRSIFYVQGNHQDEQVWVGRAYPFRYVFTEAILRDPQGNPIMDAAVRVVRYLVRYTKTGLFTAKVKHFLRGTFVYPLSGRDVGMPGQGAGQLGIGTGEFEIPVYGRAPAVEVSIESDSYLPLNIPYAEWRADVTMKSAR